MKSKRIGVDKSGKHAHSISMNVEFPKVLKRIMKERNLNQLELAGILGIRQSQISNWLGNKSLPGYFSIKMLCEKLKVSASELF